MTSYDLASAHDRRPLSPSPSPETPTTVRGGSRYAHVPSWGGSGHELLGVRSVLRCIERRGCVIVGASRRLECAGAIAAMMFIWVDDEESAAMRVDGGHVCRVGRSTSLAASALISGPPTEREVSTAPMSRDDQHWTTIPPAVLRHGAGVLSLAEVRYSAFGRGVETDNRRRRVRSTRDNDRSRQERDECDATSCVDGGVHDLTCANPDTDSGNAAHPSCKSTRRCSRQGTPTRRHNRYAGKVRTRLALSGSPKSAAMGRCRSDTCRHRARKSYRCDRTMLRSRQARLDKIHRQRPARTVRHRTASTHLRPPALRRLQSFRMSPTSRKSTRRTGCMQSQRPAARWGRGRHGRTPRRPATAHKDQRRSPERRRRRRAKRSRCQRSTRRHFRRCRQTLPRPRRMRRKSKQAQQRSIASHDRTTRHHTLRASASDAE